MTILENILNTVSTKKSFYIPAGMTVTGAFTVDVPGQIAGAVNGDVLVNGRLIILRNAVIHGNVMAQELEIMGRVTGDILCNGKMVLRNTCFVKGNISTVEIHIEKDAVIDGIITKPELNKTEEQPAAEIMETPLVEVEQAPVAPTVETALIASEDNEVHSWF